MNKNFNKIHIIGEVGSGKTFLARKLSALSSIPHFQTDNMVWNRLDINNSRYTIEQRDSNLKNAVKQDNWIIEGVHYKWLDRSFSSADIIVFLNPGTFKRDYAIILRYFKQTMGIEKGNYTQTIKQVFEMLKWNHNFKKERESILMETLKPYLHKVQYFKNNMDAYEALRRLGVNDGT